MASKLQPDSLECLATPTPKSYRVYTISNLLICIGSALKQDLEGIMRGNRQQKHRNRGTKKSDDSRNNQ